MKKTYCFKNSTSSIKRFYSFKIEIGNIVLRWVRLSELNRTGHLKVINVIVQNVEQLLFVFFSVLTNIF